MRYWQLAGLLALIALIVVIASQPAGPTVNEENAMAVKTQVRVTVLDEDGREINAHVWRNGAYWCAGKEGFLSDCAKETDGEVTIVLRRDPAERVITLQVRGCSFLAYGPKGVPLTGPVRCGRMNVKPGRYEFAFFDENGAMIDRRELFVDRNMEITVDGNAETTPAIVQVLDEFTGEEMNAWVSYGGVALRGEAVPVNVKRCSVAHAWAEEHKIMDVYICPGDEENALLPRQVNGGALIISAPGTERIVVTDRNGSVYTVISGDEAQLRDVPPGAYVIYAVDGAAVGRKTVDVVEGQRIVTINDVRGWATIETNRQIQVFAMGEKITEGSGRMKVPARTVLHIVILDAQPREETAVLLPGEVRII